MGTWEGRESQGPPPSAPLDMTTPLGLSRQHLSYLQEIGSGWFGKVSGMGGLYSCVHPPCSYHFSSAPRLLPLPPQSTHHPHLCPSLTHSHPPHPPTSVCHRQRLPPHSIDHSASPPGSPRVGLSILPSVRPRIHRTLGL